ncbi:hypothetical protein Hanom_Chr11g01044841 [Helianthus anomalus]
MHKTGQESFARIREKMMVIRLCFAGQESFARIRDCLYKDFPTLTNHTHKRIQGRVYVDTYDHTKNCKFVFPCHMFLFLTLN